MRETNNREYARMTTIIRSSTVKQGRRSVLILCAVEEIKLARNIGESLKNYSKDMVNTTLWTEADFSGWLLDNIIERISEFSFVVLIMTPVDRLTYKGQEMLSPRDNLIFELGISLAVNGYQRTLIIYPADVELKLPSDTYGLVCITYRIDNIDALCTDIYHRVMNKKLEREMSWFVYFKTIIRLNEDIHKNPSEGGFRPNIVVGINMGGMVAGGLLYYLNRGKFHFMVAWTKDESPLSDINARHELTKTELKMVLEQIKTQNKVPKVLLVDDSDKSSEAMRTAKNLVMEILKGAGEIKTAALVYRGQRKDKPDYCYYFDYDRFPYARV